MEQCMAATGGGRRIREGPEPAWCANTLAGGVAHPGGEGRINVLPWYRRVDVVSTSSETQGGKTGCPQG